MKWIYSMEFKTQFQQTVVDFICHKLKPGSPVICLSDAGKGKTTALAYAALDVVGSVVVWCPGKRCADGFISIVRTILNKRRQGYDHFDDYVKVSANKKIYTYPVGQETWDVHLEEDVECVLFDDAQHLHPMVLRRLVQKMGNKKVAITSNYLINELQGVVKVKITNNN